MYIVPLITVIRKNRPLHQASCLAMAMPCPLAHFKLPLDFVPSFFRVVSCEPNEIIQ